MSHSTSAGHALAELQLGLEAAEALLAEHERALTACGLPDHSPVVVIGRYGSETRIGLQVQGVERLRQLSERTGIPVFCDLRLASSRHCCLRLPSARRLLRGAALHVECSVDIQRHPWAEPLTRGDVVTWPAVDQVEEVHGG